MSKQDTSFVPTSAFIAKKEHQEKVVKKKMKEIFWKELYALKEDDFSDVNIFIEEEDIHLRHKCIIKMLAPTFFHNLGNTLTDETSMITTFSTEVPSEEKEKLRAVYGIPANLNYDVDLAQLLENDIDSNVTFKVQESIFNCHKCILAARSEFFALMFRGGWVENNIDVIPLQSISAESFGIILNTMYNGSLDLPKKINLFELLTFSEMYNISCLNHVLIHHLKVNYCHFFHQPCEFCISGVLDVLSICDGHIGFETLVDGCFKWFVKYYAKILPSRQFSKSNDDVRTKLKEKIKESANVSNIIQHLQDCFQAEGRISKVKSMESIKTLVKEFDDYFISYFFSNLNRILKEASFKYMLNDNKNVMKQKLLQERLIDFLPKYLNPSNCIGIYNSSLMIIKEVEVITRLTTTDECNQSEALVNSTKFANNLQLNSKAYIQKNIMAVRRTAGWKKTCKVTQDLIMKDSGFLDISS